MGWWLACTALGEYYSSSIIRPVVATCVVLPAAVPHDGTQKIALEPYTERQGSPEFCCFFIGCAIFGGRLSSLSPDNFLIISSLDVINITTVAGGCFCQLCCCLRQL